METVLAYIDPGSGSLIIQVLIASVLAVPFFLRHQIARGYRAVRRAVRPEPDGPAGPAGPPAA